MAAYQGSMTAGAPKSDKEDDKSGVCVGGPVYTLFTYQTIHRQHLPALTYYFSSLRVFNMTASEHYAVICRSSYHGFHLSTCTNEP